TGYFQDIRVTKKASPEGITLIYFVEAKPKLTDIVFVGNKKFSNSKLLKKLTSKINEPLDERKLFIDAEEIKKMYQSRGYPQTKVEVKPYWDSKTGRATAQFE